MRPRGGSPAIEPRPRIKAAEELTSGPTLLVRPYQGCLSGRRPGMARASAWPTCCIGWLSPAAPFEHHYYDGRGQMLSASRPPYLDCANGSREYRYRGWIQRIPTTDIKLIVKRSGGRNCRYRRRGDRRDDGCAVFLPSDDRAAYTPRRKRCHGALARTLLRAALHAGASSRCRPRVRNAAFGTSLRAARARVDSGGSHGGLPPGPNCSGPRSLSRFRSTFGRVSASPPEKIESPARPYRASEIDVSPARQYAQSGFKFAIRTVEAVGLAGDPIGPER